MLKRLFSLSILLTLTLLKIYSQSPEADPLAGFQIDLEKIEDEAGVVHYTLNEIVTIMLDSVILKGDIIIPTNTTEFERAIFQARKTQHNDNQLEAVKQLKTLLEFECYRTKGEELYIRLLLGSSMNYLGAPLISYSYIQPVFPDIFEEIHNLKVSSFLINHYASLLIQIDSLEQAKDIYTQNLDRYKKANETYEVYSTLNSLGFVLIKLGEYDEAKAIFLENQNEKYSSINPVVYAFSFGNYGTALMAESNYDSALFYMQKEVELMSKIPSNEKLQNTYLEIGEIFEIQNKIDSARKYYTLSLKTSIKKGVITSVVRAYEKLIQLYSLNEKKTELKKLITYYLDYSDSLKRVISLDAAKQELQVSKLLTIFDEAEESRKRFDKLENKNKDLTWAITGLITLILLMILVISFRNSNRKRLKLKNIELEEKNSELEKSYETISESNGKNQVLLKELHHRVKNNLQIISSLFNLQLNASEMDIATERVFTDAKNRIYSISLVHKKIYQSDNIDSLNFEEYLRDFSDELLNATPNDVNLSIDILRNPISIDSAIPLGLIFNELLTNSIKHAKRHDSLQINIKYSNKEGKEKFIYTDNGIGVQNIEVMKETRSSIGVTLIHLLGKQLNATINYKEAKEGVNGFWLSIQGNFK